VRSDVRTCTSAGIPGNSASPAFPNFLTSLSSRTIRATYAPWPVPSSFFKSAEIRETTPLSSGVVCMLKLGKRTFTRAPDLT